MKLAEPDTRRLTPVHGRRAPAVGKKSACVRKAGRGDLRTRIVFDRSARAWWNNHGLHVRTWERGDVEAQTMSNEGSVTRWLQPLTRGDQEAARQLFGHYFRRLVGLARNRLADAPRAAA